MRVRIRNSCSWVLATVGLVCLATSNLAQTKSSPALGEHPLTQVAVVVRDVDRAAERYSELLGVPVPKATLTDALPQAHTRLRGQPTEGRAKLAFVRLKNITIELIEPVGGPSTWQEFLEQHGEGVHHIAFDVPQVDEHVARFERAGGHVLQRGDFTGGQYLYVDATPQLGVIVELLTRQTASK
jgi:methylmalonyl-CoA/ethylmalonyl-CoA epimerase